MARIVTIMFFLCKFFFSIIPTYQLVSEVAVRYRTSVILIGFRTSRLNKQTLEVYDMVLLLTALATGSKINV
jgi:hypothetical protein